MNRLLYPLIFLLANLPESDKHLEMFNSLIQATSESVRNIRSGMENFHATLAQIGQASGKPGAWPAPGPNPPQAPQPQPKPESPPFQEPSIQMPDLVQPEPPVNSQPGAGPQNNSTA